MIGRPAASEPPDHGTPPEVVPPPTREIAAPSPSESAATSAPGDTVASRSRRRVWPWVSLAVLVVAVPVVLAIVAALSAPPAPSGDAPAALERDDADEAPPSPRPPDDVDEDVTADLDLEALSGRDEALARLLGHVDASERAMLRFQGSVTEVLEGHASSSPEEVLTDLREAARTGTRELAEHRPDLVTSVANPDIEEVRRVYLAHHDVWADYLEAVAEDPTVLGSERDGARWTLSINTSAEAFARALRDELDADLDPEVRDVGQAILDRGFDRGDVEPEA